MGSESARAGVAIRSRPAVRTEVVWLGWSLAFVTDDPLGAFCRGGTNGIEPSLDVRVDFGGESLL